MVIPAVTFHQWCLLASEVGAAVMILPFMDVLKHLDPGAWYLQEVFMVQTQQFAQFGELV